MTTRGPAPGHLEEPATPSWDFPRSVTGLGLLAEFGADRGVAAATVLAGTGLDPADLTDPETVVAAEQELTVVRNLAAALPGQEATGLEVGSRYHVTTFGILGYALLSSPTVLDAVNVTMRYLDLSHSFTIPRPSLEDDLVVVALDATGLPADVARFLVERDMAAMHLVLDELLPGGVPLRRVELAFPAPAATAAYREAFGVEPLFDAPRHSFAFGVDQLDRPLPQGNPHTRALAEQLCNDVVSRRRRRTGLTQQVRLVLTEGLAFGAGMDEVARALAMSTRTLRRRLEAEGTRFQDLLDEVREALAEELLATGMLTVEDVALRLGYAESSSFGHAFKRWKGVTPTAWLRARRVSPGT